MPLRPEMKIWMALRSVLAAEVGSIAKVEGITQQGANPGTYITVLNSPAPPSRMLLKAGQRHIRTGIMTLVYVAPIGETREFYADKAHQMANCFPEGRKINYSGVCVEIQNEPHVQEGYRDGGDWRVPITVNWRTFA